MKVGTGGPVLRAYQLTKTWGRQTGVADLDLEVGRGEVMALLGANGAGKTTTLRMLVGLVRPTRGRALLFGMDPVTRAAAVHRRTGYLPGDVALWNHMRADDLLSFLGRLRGGVRAADYRELAERLGLDLRRRVGELSRGNRQKIALVQALMHRPELLVLDEPTSGLDPMVQSEFGALIRERTQQGAGVLVSSHDLDEVQRLADRAAVLREGRLLLVDDVVALRSRVARRVQLRFDRPVPSGAVGPEMVDVRVDGTRLTCRVPGSAVPLLRQCLPLGLVDVVVEAADLEDAFLHLMRDAGRDRVPRPVNDGVPCG
jgi:ABC-2 type transport system ATP-binding protein